MGSLRSAPGLIAVVVSIFDPIDWVIQWQKYNILSEAKGDIPKNHSVPFNSELIVARIIRHYEYKNDSFFTVAELNLKFYIS